MLDKRRLLPDHSVLRTAQPGDFVQCRSWYGDVWCEVLETFGPSSNALMIATPHRGSRQEYAFFDNLRSKVHRSGMPWKRGELRIVHTRSGSFGGKEDPPLPERFRASLLEEIALAANGDE